MMDWLLMMESENDTQLLFWYRIDGATRVPTGDLGMIMKAGTNVQFTDIAPGVRAPMVSHDKLFVKQWLNIPTASDVIN